ncbi:DUF5719 family protein [Demequina sp. SYSU T00039]|uniref:DUF5719 family protein n=1 Tax=Demequina lignilytica TaxID=3051663 RepID=A0AAW7M1G6_9MICO|nr:MULTISPECIES: DUF5719 family protein [unclassified Demequina]MDN4478266.1 DUF5719 family protein [Demequina sp. SYSU T00039-1]MDN4488284.1 DUF5719 family protein [Demequina sp. SYSU T00039]
MTMRWSRVGAVLAGAAVVAAAALTGAIPAGEPLASAPYQGEVTPDQQPLACPGQVEIPVGQIESGDAALDSGSDDVAYDAEGEDRQGAGAGFTTGADTGASVERVGGGDVAGLAAAGCTAPSQEQWLVGGSTALGSSARLVLTNPTEASTEVTVTYYGPLGQVDDRTVVSVAAGGQQDLLIEGVAAETAALVTRVTATGAGVVAAIQDSRLDGFQPAGTDWVVPSASPARSLVIAGVGSAADGAETLLRLMAPEGATLDLALLTGQGAATWGGVSALELEPGVVTEVVVPQVDAGAITIEADAPVTAAAMVRVPRAVIDGPRDAQAWDLAWSPAQAIADGMPRSVRVGEHTTAVVVYAPTVGTFTLTDASGAEVVSRTLSAGTVASLPLDVAAGTELTGTAGFAWELVLEDSPGFVSRLTPRRTDVEPIGVDVTRGAYVEPS